MNDSQLSVKQNKYLKKKKMKNAISVNANGILLSGYSVYEISIEFFYSAYFLK